jgi:hypothetical protein
LGKRHAGQLRRVDRHGEAAAKEWILRLGEFRGKRVDGSFVQWLKRAGDGVGWLHACGGRTVERVSQEGMDSNGYTVTYGQ